MQNKILAFLVLWILALPVVAKEQRLSPGTLTAAHELTGLLTDGYADMYADSAKFIEFHGLSWPDASDGMVALYYIGGWGQGNTNRQVLAVFARNETLGANDSASRPYRLVGFAVVGEKGVRSIESIDLDGSTITLTGTEHGPSDPMCCPTVPVVLQYTVQNHNLVLEAHGG